MGPVGGRPADGALANGVNDMTPCPSVSAGQAIRVAAEFGEVPLELSTFNPFVAATREFGVSGAPLLRAREGPIESDAEAP